MRESLTLDYRSVGHLRFSLRGILSHDRDWRSGFKEEHRLRVFEGLEKSIWS